MSVLMYSSEPLYVFLMVSSLIFSSVVTILQVTRQLFFFFLTAACSSLFIWPRGAEQSHRSTSRPALYEQPQLQSRAGGGNNTSRDLLWVLFGVRRLGVGAVACCLACNQSVEENWRCRDARIQRLRRGGAGGPWPFDYLIKFLYFYLTYFKKTETHWKNVRKYKFLK